MTQPDKRLGNHDLDAFVSAVTKVERARSLVESLRIEISEFFQNEPYSVECIEDSETRDLVWSVSIKSHPPVQFSAVIGDTIHNLRSALDHVIWSLVIENGQEPTRQTMFPISDSASKLEELSRNRVKGISDEAFQVLQEVQPHKEGNLRLWQLHSLNNIDKHRLIIPVGSAHRSVTLNMSAGLKDPLTGMALPPINIGIRPADRQYPVQSGDELFRAKRAARSGPNFQPGFNFEIAFGEGDIIQGEPIVEVLVDFISVVEDIINRFRSTIQNP